MMNVWKGEVGNTCSRKVFKRLNKVFKRVVGK